MAWLAGGVVEWLSFDGGGGASRERHLNRAGVVDRRGAGVVCNSRARGMQPVPMWSNTDRARSRLDAAVSRDVLSPG